jgi:hypothetical protein
MTANELWLPRAMLYSETAQNFPAGSIVFYPPFSSKRTTVAPALRFDLKDGDGNFTPWLFWIQGGPWGADEARRTATLCREMYGADRRILGVEPADRVHIEIELNLGGDWQDDFSWTSALGAVASTPTGFKIAAADFSNRRLSPVPIDVATWQYDENALRSEVHGRYSNWRVRISDGTDRTYCLIDYTPPVEKE